MIDLETVRDFFARAPFMVDLGVVPTAVSAESEVYALLGQQRVLVAKLSATLAVVQPT